MKLKVTRTTSDALKVGQPVVVSRAIQTFEIFNRKTLKKELVLHHSAVRFGLDETDLKQSRMTVTGFARIAQTDQHQFVTIELG